MARPKKLRLWSDLPSPNMHEEETRVATLEATVCHYIPDFVRMIHTIKTEGNAEDVVTLAQDAFAESLHDDEYTLLGMAVKYAGQHDVPVVIVPNTVRSDSDG